MRGIPCALGWSAYISVWREVGVLCFERLAVFVPSLPPLCFPLYISVTGACLLVGVGAHGWVVRFCQPLVQSPSWSWLPIVEAPGCLGHPTSAERRSCLMKKNNDNGKVENCMEKILCNNFEECSVISNAFYMYGVGCGLQHELEIVFSCFLKQCWIMNKRKHYELMWILCQSFLRLDLLFTLLLPYLLQCATPLSKGKLIVHP